MLNQYIRTKSAKNLIILESLFIQNGDANYDSTSSDVGLSHSSLNSHIYCKLVRAL